MALPAGRPCGQPDCRTGVIPTPVKPARLPWRGAPVLIALALGGLLWLGVVAGLIALVLGAFLWRGASPPPAASPLAEAETTLPADDGSAPTEAAAEAPRPQVAAPVAAAPVPAPPVPPPQLFVIGPPPKAPAVVSRPPEAAKPAAPATPSFKRRGNASEEDLRKQLEVAIDVGLDLDGPAVVRSYAASIKANLAATGAPNLIDPSPLLKVRPDLGTLPLRGGHGVKLSPKAGGQTARPPGPRRPPGARRPAYRAGRPPRGPARGEARPTPGVVARRGGPGPDANPHARGHAGA
jgi:hypothetical protein